MIRTAPFGMKLAALVAVGLASGLAVSAPSQAQSEYANVISNNMAKCSPGNGPAVRVTINGLRSNNGNLFVRIYHARQRDWLKGKRYLTRLDASPRRGSMTVCLPVSAPGRYAVAVQHDENGNRETDFSSDGAGLSNNPRIGSFLGIPRPPSVEKAAFAVGNGVKTISVDVRYRN